MTTQKTTRTTHFINALMIFVRVLLKISIGSLILSCILLLVFGFNYEIGFGILWFSIMGSALIYYFTVAVIIILSLYCTIKKEKLWSRIKREVILMGISIACLIITGLLSNYIVPLIHPYDV